MRGFRCFGLVMVTALGCAPAAPQTAVTIPAASKAPPAPNRAVETTRLAITVLQENPVGESLPLAQAQVMVRSLTGDRPYEKRLDGAPSEWLLTDVPLGAYLEITATKAGYTTRKTLFVPVRESAGLTNRAEVLLSDAPEVVSVSPADRSSDVPADSAMVLTFSEPVDPESVERALVVSIGRNVTLSVGQSLLQDRLVFRRSQLGISWNSLNTELTVTPKGLRFPSDREYSRRPTYRVGFSAPFKDLRGHASGKLPFRLGDTSQAVSEFNVETDDLPPTPFQLKAQLGSDADRMVLTFSEPMSFALADNLFIPSPALAASPLHAAHYRVTMRFKTALRAGDAKSSQAAAAGSTGVTVDNGEGNASLLPNFVAAGDTLRFSGGAEGTVANVTGTSVTLAAPGLSQAVAKGETLWVTQVTAAPLSRSALFPKSQVKPGTALADVILDLGQTGLLLPGSMVVLDLSETLTDPAGNSVPPDKRRIEAEVGT